MSTPGSQATVHLRENVIAQHMGDEFVLLNTDTEDFISLNPVGSVIWESIATSGNIEDAYAAVTAAFDVPIDVITADVQSFLQRLPVSYPILLDVPGPADAGVRLGNPKGVLPYSVLLAADGRLLRQRLGPFADGELSSWVRDQP